MTDHYEGNWIDGQKSGEGKEYYKNGAVYIGEFANGKRQGHGVYTFQKVSYFMTTLTKKLDCFITVNSRV